ncbi:unnamed protein product [Arabidopsis halleri]
MKDGVHMFVAGDKSHPDADVIYKKLNRKMRDAGYHVATDRICLV